MKPDIHPNYRAVVFQDTTAGTSFLTRSAIETSETVEWEDGNTYPLAKVEIAKDSHPFFTGTMQIVDTAGRVERFERRYGRRKGAGGLDDGGPEDSAGEQAAAPEAAAAEADAGDSAEAPSQDS